MLFVTTASKAGFKDYGHRLLESFANAPGNARLVWYVEGYDIPETPNVEQRQLPQGMRDFARKNARYIPPSWRWDVVKFAHKVYSAVDALSKHRGIGAWIDADTVIHKKIPEGELEQYLPDGCYMSMFKRTGMYTETGFWMVNCDHPAHADFMSAWLKWYETDRFKELNEWHDCMTLDATVRTFEKAGAIETFSLSGKHEKQMHPLSYSPLGAWFDHCKGQRKTIGRSPENTQRAA